MTCGSAASCQHWQRTSCSGSSKVALQCLVKSGRIPSLPGACHDVTQSIALLAIALDGCESNYNNNNGRNGSCLTWLAGCLIEERVRCIHVNMTEGK